jgi:hypothetical protein
MKSINDMKRFRFHKSGFLLVLLLSLSMSLSAQNQLQDVVYLLNGSIIRGIIIEQIPGQSIKIQTADGNVFVYEMYEVQKITKEAPVQPVGSGSSVPLPKKAFYLNPLGVLQFGPMIGGEFKVSDDLLFDVHLRYPPLGLAYQAITSEGFEDAVSWAALSFGPGIKYLFENPSTPNRFYIATYLEYGFGGSSGDIGTSEEWEGKFSYMVIAFNFGHRWVNALKNTYIGVGIFAGASPGIKDEWWYIDSPGEIYQGENPTLFFGMLELTFGWGSD